MSSTTFAFTPAVVISAGIEKALTTMTGDSMVALVHALAEKHDFDADETIRELGLADIQVLKKKRVAKAPKEPKEPKEKKVKEVKPPRDAPKCVLPWTGVAVDRDWCQAIKYNHGLYNQCSKERVADGLFCKGCTTQCEKNGTGKPDFGTIEDRLACGLFDYKAGKDQKPCLPLANVLNKPFVKGVTREQFEEEAARFGLEIPEEHWEIRVAQRGRPKTDKPEEPKEEKKRGRPVTKKAKTQESAPGEDLIASLVADAMKAAPESDEETFVTEEEDDVSSDDDEKTIIAEDQPEMPEEEEKPVKIMKKKTKKVMTEEEKAAKEAAKAEEKAAKEAEKAAAKAKAAEEKAKKAAEEKAKKEAEKAAEKAAKEAAKEAEKKAKEAAKAKAAEEKAAKEAAKEAEKKAKEAAKAKAAEEKAAKEAAKAEEKAKKEAEKKAKAEEKAAKEAAKAKKEAKKEAEEEEVVAAPAPSPEMDEDAIYEAETEDEDDDDDEEEAVVVRKFVHDGTTYLRDENTNILYDVETQDEVGIWNPETKSIDEIEEEDDE